MGSKLTALFLLLGLAMGAQALPARSLRAAAAAPAPAPLQVAPAPAPLAADAILPAEGATISLTAEEVAKHTTQGDCWYIYNGSVYDVSQYLADGLHPGGNDVILEYCGKDATAEFDSVHRGSQPRQEQEGYLLGPLA